MKRILFVLIALSAQAAFAIGGGGGTGKFTDGGPVSYQPVEESQVDFLLHDVVEESPNGDLVVHAIDRDGQTLLLRIEKANLVPTTNGAVGIRLRVDNI